MRIALVVASIALAASASASAQDHYRLHTAAVLAGAYGYFLSATPAADRFVCPPTPSVTRTQVANGFVAWLKARPQYNNDGAIDALFRYAAEAYPCKR
jgi:Rap1a immunity proteins